jgi:PAP2 superfamily
VAERVPRRPLWWRLVHEALVLGALWIAYTLGRALAGRHVGSAYGHATQVWRLERDLRLPDEARVQAWALDRTWLIQAANDYYKYEHWIALAIVTCWLLAFRPEHYPWFRRTLVLLTGLALVGHFAYPLMPPRMRPDFGLVDTGVRFGQSVYGADHANHGLLNQYAAMPSMHVGWATLFAVTVVVVARTPWRWLAVVYPAVTTWVVVATGNHYWLDGVVGVLLLALALGVVHRIDRQYAPRPPTTAATVRATSDRSSDGDQFST